MKNNKEFKEEREIEHSNSFKQGTKEINKKLVKQNIEEEKEKLFQQSPKPVEKKNENNEEVEEITQTCFSSEAEEKFKAKGIRKLNSFIKKQFEPPQIQGNTKFADLKARTIWTVIMLLLFMLFILGGTIYCSLLVVLIITCIFLELTDLNKYRNRNLEIKWYYPLAWYFFSLGMYYFIIRATRENLLFLEKYKICQILFQHHSFICFLIYCLGFGIFLKSLTRGHLRYQFSSFAFNHLIILMLSLTSGLLIANIFHGLFWFVLPCGMVICNDISAYIWGRMFGRTRLTELSPKKTVEGFIGAFITTIIYSYVICEIFMHFNFFRTFLCPNKEVTLVPFVFHECDTSKFSTTNYSIYTYRIMDIQLHTFAVAMFTSILAPMGGFFASGFKRAIKIKDFSDTIPGHGGFTDRMDCQLLVGIFTSLWLSNFVYIDNLKFGIIITLLGQISHEGKLKVLEYLNSSHKI